MPAVLPKAVRELTQELTSLPGVGMKTAQRLALHILRQQRVATDRLAQAIATLHDKVQTCSVCFSLADDAICNICKDTTRNKTTLCIVEDALDVEAIERTGSYTGVYHVLGGLLSPLAGIGADQLTLSELISRA